LQAVITALPSPGAARDRGGFFSRASPLPAREYRAPARARRAAASSLPARLATSWPRSTIAASNDAPRAPSPHPTMTAAGAGSRIATSDDEIHSLTFERPSCGGFSRPAAARTGYVVLRIEPSGQGRPSRPWRASSAFPTLTGPMALAAGLRGPGGPSWPLLGAVAGLRRLAGLVDRLGTKRRPVTVEGRFLTLGGQRTPARC